MSSLSKPSVPSPGDSELHEQVVSHITPFFLDDASDDPVPAMEAARQTLVCYNAATGKELQLSAQIVAFSMASLDCLRCSMTERDMSIDDLLRIQGHAIALNGLAEKSRKALEARQRDRQRGQAATQATVQLDEAEFRAAIDKALRMVTFARAKLTAHQAGRPPASSISATTPVPPAQKAPVLPARVAEQVTPDVLARRKDAIQLWAKDVGQLTPPLGQTKH